jgi:hypothetical protein
MSVAVNAALHGFRVQQLDSPRVQHGAAEGFGDLPEALL